jgi:hypothetical protein
LDFERRTRQGLTFWVQFHQTRMRNRVWVKGNRASNGKESTLITYIYIYIYIYYKEELWINKNDILENWKIWSYKIISLSASTRIFWS